MSFFGRPSPITESLAATVQPESLDILLNQNNSAGFDHSRIEAEEEEALACHPSSSSSFQMRRY